MAKPQREIPETATNRDPPRPREGEAALRAVLEERGGDLADALEHTDELEDVFTTATLVIASAEEEDVDYVAESLVALLNAADGLSTEATVELAERVGENGEELAETLDTVLRLQRGGHVEEFVRVAEALGESMEPDEAERVARLLGENAGDTADALEQFVDLQRSGDLEPLLELASTFSELEVDDDTVRGLNNLLGAVGDAERRSEPVGLLGAVRRLSTEEARTGLGYLVSVVRAQGRRLRSE